MAAKKSMTPLQKWIQNRVDDGYRLAEIATFLNVSIKSIKAYRAGTRRPGADNLFYIADRTQLDPADIRKG